ncbi:MAG: hypothetical protein AAF914_13355, partial [Pseudomonadota bacterium]
MLLASGLLGFLRAGPDAQTEPSSRNNGLGADDLRPIDRSRPAGHPDTVLSEGSSLDAHIGRAARDLCPPAGEALIDGFGTVPVVTDFLPGIDRLCLSFDTGTALPLVTLNQAIEPGSTAVMGNGALMVMLRGIEGVALTDIALETLPAGAPEARDPVPFFDDFDPRTDVVEVLYDATISSDPVVQVADFDDGTGATVLLDGHPVISVAGA